VWGEGGLLKFNLASAPAAKQPRFGRTKMLSAKDQKGKRTGNLPDRAAVRQVGSLDKRDGGDRWEAQRGNGERNL